jgi:sugar phosphate permease
MILDKYNWNAVFMTLAAGCIICFLLVLTIIEPVDNPVARRGAK